MSLADPVPAGQLTQRFGHSTMALQPSMYRAGDTKAYWQPFAGAALDVNCHNGIDKAAGEGTPIVAMEAGTVVDSRYDDINGGGHLVTVEIRPDVRFTVNHCLLRLVQKGQRVKRGQLIAQVGRSGTIYDYATGRYLPSVTGPHAHCNVSIREQGADKVWRTMLYNPLLFMAGGKLANDARIKPLAAPKPTGKYATLKGPNINIRSSADLQADNIWGFSRDGGHEGPGIYTRAGAWYAELTSRFIYLTRIVNDGGEWARVLTGSAVLYVKHELVTVTT